MSKRMQQNLVAVIIFAMFAVALVASLDYGPRARMVPVPISILGMILIAVEMIWQNLRSGNDLQIDSVELITGRKKAKAADGSDDQPAPPQAAPRDGWRAWLDGESAAYVLVILLLAPFLVLSPIPAVFLFTAGYFVLSGHCSWLRGLTYAVICTGVLYVMFGVVLNIDLNRGLAIPLINQVVRF